MRFSLLIPALAITVIAHAQNQSARFIEVLVSDTVMLPFTGIDYEVAMPSPMDLLTWDDTDEERSDKDNERMMKEAMAKARTIEDHFLNDMGNGGFTFKKSSSTHTEDYQLNTGQSIDVNTYTVTLKDGPEMERFNNVMAVNDALHPNVKDMHYGPTSAEAPRLMRKLFDQAKKKADAIVGVTGGKLGGVISVQEVEKNEGSILEQLFKMDKMHNDEETMRLMNATHTVTMLFRFEFLPL